MSEGTISGIIATHDKLFRGRISYKDSKITKVEREQRKAEHEFKDNCIIFPGFIDKHVHPREFPLPKEEDGKLWNTFLKHIAKDDFISMSEAAIYGGVTYVCCIPNTPRPPLDQAVYDEYRAISKKSRVPVLMYAMIVPGSRPFGNDKPYKFMWSSVGGAEIRSDAELWEILEPYRTPPGGKPYRVAIHCESIDELAKRVNYPTHEDKRSPPVQSRAVALALAIQEEFGFELDIMHISDDTSLYNVNWRWQADNAAPVTIEATPHHMLLDRSARIDPKFKYSKQLFMNPPLVDRPFKLDLTPGIGLHLHLGKEIQFVSSDHAGHTLADKEAGAAGITGLQIMGHTAAELINRYNIPPSTIAKVFAYNPGKFVERFTGEKVGDIAPGYAASFTVLDLGTGILMDDAFFTPKCGWNPWHGYSFSGKVAATFVKGELMTPGER